MNVLRPFSAIVGGLALISIIVPLAGAFGDEATSRGRPKPRLVSKPPLLAPIKAEYDEAHFQTRYFNPQWAVGGVLAMNQQWQLGLGCVDVGCVQKPGPNHIGPGLDSNRCTDTEEIAGQPNFRDFIWRHGDFNGCKHTLQGPSGHQGIITFSAEVSTPDPDQISPTQRIWWRCTAVYRGTNSGTGEKPKCLRMGYRPSEPYAPGGGLFATPEPSPSSYVSQPSLPPNEVFYPRATPTPTRTPRPKRTPKVRLTPTPVVSTNATQPTLPPNEVFGPRSTPTPIPWPTRSPEPPIRGGGKPGAIRPTVQIAAEFKPQESATLYKLKLTLPDDGSYLRRGSYAYVSNAQWKLALQCIDPGCPNSSGTLTNPRPNVDAACNESSTLPAQSSFDPPTFIWYHGDLNHCSHAREGPSGHQGLITATFVIKTKVPGMYADYYRDWSCTAKYPGSNTGTGLDADCVMTRFLYD